MSVWGGFFFMWKVKISGLLKIISFLPKSSHQDQMAALCTVIFSDLFKLCLLWKLETEFSWARFSPSILVSISENTWKLYYWSGFLSSLFCSVFMERLAADWVDLYFCTLSPLKRRNIDTKYWWKVSQKCLFFKSPQEYCNINCLNKKKAVQSEPAQGPPCGPEPTFCIRLLDLGKLNGKTWETSLVKCEWPPGLLSSMSMK